MMVRRPLLGLWLALAVTACSNDVSSACQEVCECEGCDEASCTEKGQAAEDASRDAGCSLEFDDYVACIRDDFSCEDGAAAATNCATKAATLETCGGVAPSLGNPCREVGTICADGVETGNIPACRGFLRCRSQCIIDAGNCDDATTIACAEQCPTESGS